MKKKFKNKGFQNIMFFIFGAVIFGSVGIVATTNKLEAKYVMYTKDGETMTVQDAIKDLYVKASKGNNQTLALGTPNVVSYTVTVPYTGSYSNVGCVYGTTESYGSTGTISGNKCTFTGTAANQTLYYKIVATANNGKIYENIGSIATAKSLADSVRLGDYIYMKPTKTSYSITSDMTGCVSGLDAEYCNGIDGASQTINPSELTVWRVIRKNSDGTVDVVSENVSSKNVYFYGQTGYQNLVGSLNKIAAQYTSNYVQSTRYMGYSNQTENITDTSKLTQTTAPWTSSTSSSTTSADEALGAGDLGYRTDYNLVNTALGTLVANNPSGTATSYWLASRSYIYTNSNYWSFHVCSINASGKYDSFILYYYLLDWKIKSVAYAVRPILTLKSTVKIVGGTGTSNDNYKLGL